MKTPPPPPKEDVRDKYMKIAIQNWDGTQIRAAAESGANTTPLLVEAIHRQKSDMAIYAIEKGADIHGPLKIGGLTFTALHYCHAKNADRTVLDKMLAAGVPIDQPDANGDTIALKAAREGRLDDMKAYVDRGADLSRHMQQIFFEAVKNQQLPHVEWALAQGADPQATIKEDDVRHNALHIQAESARKKGYLNEKLAEKLISLGLAVDSRTSDGDTPLAIVCDGDSIISIRFFLERGADPLAQNNQGRTPADRALWQLERRPSVGGHDIMQLMMSAIHDNEKNKAPDIASGRDVRAVRAPVFTKNNGPKI